MSHGIDGRADIRLAIAAWLVAEQDLSTAEAKGNVDAFADDVRVLQIATAWMASGKAPTEPVVCNLTPASLAEDFKPSVVLGLMYALYNTPEAADYGLKYPHEYWFRKRLVFDDATGEARFEEPEAAEREHVK